VPLPRLEQEAKANGGVVTVWPPPLPAQPTVSYLADPVPPGDGLFEPLGKRHVMNHYITVLTGHLSVSEQFNSFISGMKRRVEGVDTCMYNN
jgi:hypothetical protein